MNAIINLSRAKHMLTEKTKIILYNTLVTPHFTYGDIIWGGCSQENARKLQVAQNFAMRTIKNKRKRESAKEILHEMKYLNLAEKRQVHEAVFITKSLLNKTAQNITNKYLLYLSEADTRQAQKGRLKIPEHRTTAFKDREFQFHHRSLMFFMFIFFRCFSRASSSYSLLCVYFPPDWPILAINNSMIIKISCLPMMTITTFN